MSSVIVLFQKITYILGGYDSVMNTIIYASVACSQEFFENHFNESVALPGQAVQKYNRLIIEGLSKNQDILVETVTSVPVSRATNKNFFYKGKTENKNDIIWNYLPYINIKWIRDIATVVFSFVKGIKLCAKQENVCIIADVLNAPVALGTYLASRVKKKKYVISITDDPVLCGCGKAYYTASNYLIRKSDAYIFITEAMREKYQVGNKKSLIIEGLVDVNENAYSNPKEITNSNKFIVMYTGSIHKIYGIENLVKAFIDANISDSELHVYGDGDYRDTLIDICNKNKSVVYHGTVLSSKIIEIQKYASLLVNPRPIEDEYTKYSFPSKNMEYMVSGTPVLTTDLPGMPQEYKEYVFIIEDYSIEGIKDRLCEIASMDKKELMETGQRAREFVLNKKNNIVQARKIVEMIYSL